MDGFWRGTFLGLACTLLSGSTRLAPAVHKANTAGEVLSGTSFRSRPSAPEGFGEDEVQSGRLGHISLIHGVVHLVHVDLDAAFQGVLAFPGSRPALLKFFGAYTIPQGRPQR